jgi:hypothetical protein
MVAVACLTVVLATLTACADEDTQYILWSCNLLAPEEVTDAFDLAVQEKDFAPDEVRAEGIDADVGLCQWNTSSADTLVELQTAQTLDLFAAYASSDGGGAADRQQVLDGRDEPLVLDRLALDSQVPGEGKTVLLADKGRSLALQCRRPGDGGSWRDDACLDLAKKAMDRVSDDNREPDGKVPASNACDLLPGKDVQKLTRVAAIVPGTVQAVEAGGRPGIDNFECRWGDGVEDSLITVRAGLRTVAQCQEPNTGKGMFEKNGDSYDVDTGGTTVRLGAAKGEYCLHFAAVTSSIRAAGGDLTVADAKKLFETAVDRLDGR